MNRILLSTAIAGALALGAVAPASATTGVDLFYYDGYGNFVDDSWGNWFVNPELSDTGQTFAWGGDGRSSAVLNPDEIDGVQVRADGAFLSQFDNPPYMEYDIVNDNGTRKVNSKVAESVSFDFENQPNDPDRSWAVMGYLVHQNDVIPESNTEGNLDNSTIDIDYTVDFFAPDNPEKTGDPIYSLTESFTLEFWETLNDQDPIPGCDGDNPFGSNCDDRFQYSRAGGPFQEFENEVIDRFEYEGLQYDVTMTGFVCPIEGCIGAFYSEEDGNRLGVILLDVHLVPEPGIIALMAVGLTGIGFASRRRKLRDDSMA